MNNAFKSPCKSPSLSLQTCSYSKTPNQNKSKPLHSQSKYAPSSIKINEAINQAYTNVLNRLLRINQLAQFVKQASHYVILTEELIANLKVNEKQSRKSRKQVPEIGRTLLIDGGFIKHYCKLMERYFPNKSNHIRQMCYQRYKDEVVFRKKMFDFYFKPEIAEQTSKMNQLLNSRSKALQYSNKQIRVKSANKSYKKGAVENSRQNNLEFKDCKNDQQLGSKEVLTVSFPTTPHQSIHQNNSVSSLKTKRAQGVQNSRQIVQIESDYQQFRKRAHKLKQTEEEREKRLDGIVKNSSFLSNKPSRRKIVTFQEQIKSNKKLAEIYDQIMKEKRQREKNESQQKEIAATQMPVVRTEIDKKLARVETVRLKKVSDFYEKLFEIQEEILSQFPNIYKKGTKEGVTLECSIVLGTYKNYIVKKVEVTDKYSGFSPIHKGLLFQTIDPNNKPNLAEYELEKDEEIQVLLVN